MIDGVPNLVVLQCRNKSCGRYFPVHIDLQDDQDYRLCPPCFHPEAPGHEAVPVKKKRKRK